MPIPTIKIEEKASQVLDYSQMKKNLTINIEKKYEAPPTIIEVIQNHFHFRFGTRGNFSVIGGKGKARKTFVVSSILAAAISGNKIMNFKGTEQNLEVVLFDTEQSTYDLYNSAKRSVYLNNINYHPENYKVFGLRPLSAEDRLYFIENYIEENKIDFALIDGVRDLLIDVNNPDESNKIVTRIMQWTEVFNFHMSLVLHENPGSDKLRGHLGTELNNKAEMVISVEKPPKNPSISIITAKATRGTRPFNQFAFEINEENGLPEILEGYEENPF